MVSLPTKNDTTSYSLTSFDIYFSNNICFDSIANLFTNRVPTAITYVNMIITNAYLYKDIEKRLKIMLIRVALTL
jgi:hypothetical protein